MSYLFMIVLLLAVAIICAVEGVDRLWVILLCAGAVIIAFIADSGFRSRVGNG